MANKYHYDPATGKTGVCSASVRPCRYGFAPGEHHDSAGAAQAAWEASQSVVPPSARKQRAYSPDELVSAFTEGDCWTLAYALADRYEGLVPHVLVGEDGYWCHMLVEDTRDGTYVDIMGVQTSDQVNETWDSHEEWDEITDATLVIDPPLTDTDRLYRDVPVQAGIEHIIASGWTPPPLRAPGYKHPR